MSTIYTQVGETEIRFTVRVHYYQSKRVEDFLAGMGVVPEKWWEWDWTFQMTLSQKARWDAWFAKLN